MDKNNNDALQNKPSTDDAENKRNYIFVPFKQPYLLYSDLSCYIVYKLILHQWFNTSVVTDLVQLTLSLQVDIVFTD